MSLGTIKLDKLFEKNNIGFYKVSTNDYEGNDFYLAIDKQNRLLKFYLSDDFLNPIQIINCADGSQFIKLIPMVHKRTLYGALTKALKIMDYDYFPNHISYSA